MSDQNTQEPTMEEILASIRRIISEDEPAATASSEAETASPPHGDEHDVGEDEDILELTQRVETPEPEPSYDEPSQTSGDLDIYERPAAAPRAHPPAAFDVEPDYEEEPSGDPAEGLVSEPAAAYASTVFTQLARTVEMPGQGRTLEDVVRELLRPLLKDWLDANLPGIVETAVQAEVERISRRRFS
jgi:hypothetical protein